MAYLHARRLVHGDLKSANVMLQAAPMSQHLLGGGGDAPATTPPFFAMPPPSPPPSPPPAPASAPAVPAPLTVNAPGGCSRGWVAKLADFGLARMLAPAGPEGAEEGLLVTKYGTVRR